MELNYFKDKIFDVLNENNMEMEISDIETHEQENAFTFFMADGSTFEIECRQIPNKEV